MGSEHAAEDAARRGTELKQEGAGKASCGTGYRSQDQELAK